MTAAERLKNLAEMSIGRLLMRFAWPALISMTLNGLYAVVDGVYVGHGCGQDALAALTLSFPVFMVFAAFGVFVGAGHAALLSIKLGQKDHTACEEILGEMIALKVLMLLTIAPLIYFSLDAILAFTGGTQIRPQALSQAKTYLQIVLFSEIFSHFAFGLSGTMRSEGAVMQSMVCIVLGFVMNLILDPIFIFGLKMGVAGAGWATNISMFLSCVCAFSYYRPGNSSVRLRLRAIRLYRTHLPRACGIGLSPALQQFMGSVINISMQRAFVYWSPNAAASTTQLSSLGAFQMMLLLFLMPVMGVQQGLAPIIGYNWGARAFGRVRRTVWLGLGVTTAFVTCAALVQVGFPEWIASWFGSDEQFIRLAAHDLRLSNCMLWCIGVNIVATTYFQSIGHPTTATVLSLMRQCLCLLPCIWILPHLMKDATFAIWLSLPISDVLACLVTLVPLALHMRFLGRAAHLSRPVPLPAG